MRVIQIYFKPLSKIHICFKSLHKIHLCFKPLHKIHICFKPLHKIGCILYIASSLLKNIYIVPRSALSKGDNEYSHVILYMMKFPEVELLGQRQWAFNVLIGTA